MFSYVIITSCLIQLCMKFDYKTNKSKCNSKNFEIEYSQDDYNILRRKVGNWVCSNSLHAKPELYITNMKFTLNKHCFEKHNYSVFGKVTRLLFEQ